MNVISEAEKQQLLAPSQRSLGHDQMAGNRAPSPPRLPILDYLVQVEQFARLFPQKTRHFATGQHWKL